MRNVLVILFVIMLAPSAWACSYSFPSPIRAIQSVDLLFEGIVYTAYVDGRQVSTEVLHDYIQRGKDQVTVQYKIIPGKIYKGPETDLIELTSLYDRNNPCNDFVWLGNSNSLWGATSSDGVYYTGNYVTTISLSIQQLFNSRDAYLEILEKVRDNGSISKKAMMFVLRELQALTDYTGTRLTDLPSQLRTSNRELAVAPIHILQARLELLLSLELRDEYNRTQLTIAARSSTND